ncbi:titin homolog isoform X2 [Anabrus simplex]|uniref:titin homolog isoform X2 n=1 Tax=Anabrus simplex TaxID=316456 RepID=UPI0035A279F4
MKPFQELQRGLIQVEQVVLEVAPELIPQTSNMPVVRSLTQCVHTLERKITEVQRCTLFDNSDPKRAVISSVGDLAQPLIQLKKTLVQLCLSYEADQPITTKSKLPNLAAAGVLLEPLLSVRSMLDEIERNISNLKSTEQVMDPSKAELLSMLEPISDIKATIKAVQRQAVLEPTSSRVEVLETLIKPLQTIQCLIQNIEMLESGIPRSTVIQKLIQSIGSLQVGIDSVEKSVVSHAELNKPEVKAFVLTALKAPLDELAVKLNRVQKEGSQRPEEKKLSEINSIKLLNNLGETLKSFEVTLRDVNKDLCLKGTDLTNSQLQSLSESVRSLQKDIAMVQHQAVLESGVVSENESPSILETLFHPLQMLQKGLVTIESQTVGQMCEISGSKVVELVAQTIHQLEEKVSYLEKQADLKTGLTKGMFTAVGSLSSPLRDIQRGLVLIEQQILQESKKEPQSEIANLSALENLVGPLKQLNSDITNLLDPSSVAQYNDTHAERKGILTVLQPLSHHIPEVQREIDTIQQKAVLEREPVYGKSQVTILQVLDQPLQDLNKSLLMIENLKTAVAREEQKTEHLEILKDVSDSIVQLKQKINSIEKCSQGGKVEDPRKQGLLLLRNLNEPLQELSNGLLFLQDQVQTIPVTEPLPEISALHALKDLTSSFNLLEKELTSIKRIALEPMSEQMAKKVRTAAMKAISKSIQELRKEIAVVQQQAVIESGALSISAAPSVLETLFKPLQKLQKCLSLIEESKLSTPQTAKLVEMGSVMILEAVSHSVDKLTEKILKIKEAEELKSTKACSTESISKLGILSEPLVALKHGLDVMEYQLIESSSKVKPQSATLCAIETLVKPLHDFVQVLSLSENVQTFPAENNDARMLETIVNPMLQLEDSIVTIQNQLAIESGEKGMIDEPSLVSISQPLDDLRKRLLLIKKCSTDQTPIQPLLQQSSFSALKALALRVEELQKNICDADKQALLMSTNAELFQSITEALNLLHGSFSEIEGGILSEGQVDLLSEKISPSVLKAIAVPVERVVKSLVTSGHQTVADSREVPVPLKSVQILPNDLTRAIFEIRDGLIQVENLVVLEAVDEPVSELIDASTAKTLIHGMEKLRCIRTPHSHSVSEPRKENISENINKSLVISMEQPLTEIREKLSQIEKNVIASSSGQTLSEIVRSAIVEAISIPVEEIQKTLSDITHHILLEIQTEDESRKMASALKTIVMPIHKLQKCLTVMEQGNALEIQDWPILQETNGSVLHHITQTVTDFQEVINTIKQHADYKTGQGKSECISDITSDLATLAELIHEAQKSIGKTEHHLISEPNENSISEKTNHSILRTMAQPLQELQKHLVQVEQVILDAQEEPLLDKGVFSGIKVLAQPVQEIQREIAVVNQQLALEAGGECISQEESISMLQNILKPVEELHNAIALIEQQEVLDTRERSITDEMSTAALKAVVKPLQQLHQALATVQEHTVMEPREESMSEKSSFSVLKTLAEPLHHLQQHLVQIEQQIPLESQDDISEQGLNLSLLRTLAQPIEEVQRGIAVIEHQTVLDVKGESISDEERLSLLQTLAKPIEEMQRGIAQIEQQLILEGKEESMAEGNSITTLLSVAKPIQELHLALASAQEQIALETREESISEKTNISILKTLAEPLQQLQQHIVQVEHQVPLEFQEDPASEGSSLSLLKALAQPVEEIQRGIAMIEHQTILESKGESISERDSLSILQTLAQPIVELHKGIVQIQQQVLLDAKEQSISEKTDIAALEAVANHIQELYQSIVTMQPQMIFEAQEETLSDKTNISILKTLGQPLQELHEHLVQIEQQVVFEPQDEPMSDKSNLSLLKTLAKPVEDIQRGIAMIDHQTALEATGNSISEDKAKNILHALAQPVEELYKCIAKIEHQVAVEAREESMSEKASISLLKTMAQPIRQLHQGIITHEQTTLEGGETFSEKCQASLLQTLAQPVHELRQGLAVIEHLVMMEPKEEPLSVKEDISLLQTLAHPVHEIQQQLAQIEQQITLEAEHSQGRVGLDLLHSMAVPLQELKRNIAIIEQHAQLEIGEKCVGMADIPLIKALAKPLQELERGILLISQQEILEGFVEPTSEDGTNFSDLPTLASSKEASQNLDLVNVEEQCILEGDLFTLSEKPDVQDIKAMATCANEPLKIRALGEQQATFKYEQDSLSDLEGLTSHSVSECEEKAGVITEDGYHKGVAILEEQNIISGAEVLSGSKGDVQKITAKVATVSERGIAMAESQDVLTAAGDLKSFKELSIAKATIEETSQRCIALAEGQEVLNSPEELINLPQSDLMANAEVKFTQLGLATVEQQQLFSEMGEISANQVSREEADINQVSFLGVPEVQQAEMLQEEHVETLSNIESLSKEEYAMESDGSLQEAAVIEENEAVMHGSTISGCPVPEAQVAKLAESSQREAFELEEVMPLSEAETLITETENRTEADVKLIALVAETAIIQDIPVTQNNKLETDLEKECDMAENSKRDERRAYSEDQAVQSTEETEGLIPKKKEDQKIEENEVIIKKADEQMQEGELLGIKEGEKHVQEKQKKIDEDDRLKKLEEKQSSLKIENEEVQKSEKEEERIHKKKIEEEGKQKDRGEEYQPEKKEEVAQAKGKTEEQNNEECVERKEEENFEKFTIKDKRKKEEEDKIKKTREAEERICLEKEEALSKQNKNEENAKRKKQEEVEIQPNPQTKEEELQKVEESEKKMRKDDEQKKEELEQKKKETEELGIKQNEDEKFKKSDKEKEGVAKRKNKQDTESKQKGEQVDIKKKEKDDLELKRKQEIHKKEGEAPLKLQEEESKRKIADPERMKGEGNMDNKMKETEETEGKRKETEELKSKVKDDEKVNDEKFKTMEEEIKIKKGNEDAEVRKGQEEKENESQEREEKVLKREEEADQVLKKEKEAELQKREEERKKSLEEDRRRKIEGGEEENRGDVHQRNEIEEVERKKKEDDELERKRMEENEELMKSEKDKEERMRKEEEKDEKEKAGRERKEMEMEEAKQKKEKDDRLRKEEAQKKEDDRKRKDLEDRKIKKEAEKKKKEEGDECKRKKMEEEDRKRNELEDRKIKEEERKRKEEEECKRKEMEEERKKKELEDIKIKEEEERKRKEEEECKRKQMEDEERKRKEIENRKIKEEEERKKKEEEEELKRKKIEEDERKRKELEDQKLKEEEERKKKEEEERKRKKMEEEEIEERKRKELKDQKLKEEEVRKKKEEEEYKRKKVEEEEERKRKEREDQKLKEEEERKKIEDDERKRKEMEEEEKERKRKELRDRKLKEEEERKKNEEEERKKKMKEEEEQKRKELEDQKLKEEEERKKIEEDERQRKEMKEEEEKRKKLEDQKLKEEEERKKIEEDERKRKDTKEEEQQQKRKELEDQKLKEEKERKKNEEDERMRKEMKEEEEKKIKELEDQKLKEEEERKKNEERERKRKGMEEEEERKRKELKLKEEEDRKKKEEEERKRKKMKEERKRKELEDQKLKEEEERKENEERERKRKKVEEEERKRKELEDQKLKEEEGRKKKEEEERKRKEMEEEERKTKEIKDRKLKEEEERKKREEEERERKKMNEEEERKRKEVKDQKLKEEEERKNKEEEERKRKKIEEERQRKELEDRKIKEEEERKSKEEECKRKKTEEEERMKRELDNRKIKEDGERKKKEDEYEKNEKEKEEREVKELEDRKMKEEEERKKKEAEEDKRKEKEEEERRIKDLQDRKLKERKKKEEDEYKRKEKEEERKKAELLEIESKKKDVDKRKKTEDETLTKEKEARKMKEQEELKKRDRGETEQEDKGNYDSKQKKEDEFVVHEKEVVTQGNKENELKNREDDKAVRQQMEEKVKPKGDAGEDKRKKKKEDTEGKKEEMEGKRKSVSKRRKQEEVQKLKTASEERDDKIRGDDEHVEKNEGEEQRKSERIGMKGSESEKEMEGKNSGDKLSLSKENEQRASRKRYDDQNAKKTDISDETDSSEVWMVSRVTQRSRSSDPKQWKEDDSLVQETSLESSDTLTPSDATSTLTSVQRSKSRHRGDRSLSSFEELPSDASHRRSGPREKVESGPRDYRKKPVFCTRLTDRTAAQGSRIKLTCSVLGSPDPVVHWLRDGLPLETSSKDRKFRTTCEDGLACLEVLEAAPGDSGEYTCVARNLHGETSSTATLKVYAGFEPAPFPPTFTRAIRDVYRVADDELVLECRVRSQPAPRITWLKNGSPIAPSSRYQQTELPDGVCRLTISSPDAVDDSGQYTCRAENALWSDQISSAIRFTGREQHLASRRAERVNGSRVPRDVKRPHFTSVLTDHLVPSGGTIALQVEVKGAPKPEVTWLRGSEQLPPSPKYRTFEEAGVYTLMVADATESEAGMYTCRAYNVYGHMDTSAAVQVVPPGSVRGGRPAMFVSRPDNVMAVAVGEDITVSFRVTGDPKPRVTWMKGTRDITNSQRCLKETIDDYVRLTLKRALPSDVGTYCILAKNVYGCDRSFVTVRIRQRARSLTPGAEVRLQETSIILRDVRDELERTRLKDVPTAVSGEPVVTDSGRNWLTLSWPKSENRGGVPVLAYRVEAWELGDSGGARWVELGVSPINSFDAFNLKPGCEYQFRVTPRNRYGWGESVTTSNPVLVGKPVELPEFVRILPGQLKALRGSSIRLECQVRGDPIPQVRWYRDGTELDFRRDNCPRFSTSFNGNLCVLEIKDLQDEDTGRYMCEATNKEGRVSTFARLMVVSDPKIWEADTKLKRGIQEDEGLATDSPPQFTMRLRDRRVQMTYPVRLTCQVAGRPTPELVWSKDGQELKQDERHTFWNEEHFHTLELSHTTLEDSGCYSATARNAHGSVSCRCHLVVDKGIRAYVAPEFIFELEPEYSVKEGGNLRLSAQVEAYPTVGVMWHRDGVRLRPSRRTIMTLNHDGTVELALAGVTARDAGVYSCTATNEVGRCETSGRVSVLVTTPPPVPKPPQVIGPDIPYSKVPLFITKPRSTEAIEGDTVIIHCEVVGDPKPEVMWLRDWLKPDYYRDAPHFRRVGDGPEYRLEIPRAKLDYTGAYSVIARNCHGEAKAVISLQIYAKGQGKEDRMDASSVKHGKVQTLPVIKRELKDLRCCDGDAVTLECRVFAIPTPDIRWEKGGRLVPLGGDFSAEFDGENARLSIQQVFPEDEGEYTCVAYNELGRALTSACLVVDVPEEKETLLSRQLSRPPGLLSAGSTPRSTPRTTPTRSKSPSVSRFRDRDVTPLDTGSRPRRLKVVAPKFYAVPHNRVAEEGETVRFQCAIAGHPTPWVTWDKDGLLVTPSARLTLSEKDDLRVLQVEEVTPEDAGLYRVTLENEVGRVEASARLEVIGRHGSRTRAIRAWSASPRTSPTFGRRLIGSAARVGGRMALACDIRGSPAPATTWYRNGEMVVRSERVTPSWDGRTARLEIEPLEPEDAGVYTCVAENEAGKTSCSAKVEVLDLNDKSDRDRQPPHFLQDLPKDTMAVDGQPLELQVRLQGTSPIDVVWVKDDNEIPDCDDFRYVDYGDGRFALRIADVFPQDAGEYRCEAFSPHGEPAVTCGRLHVHECSTSGNMTGRLLFSKKPSPVVAVPGGSAAFCARLQCDDPAAKVRVSWSVAGRPVRGSSRFKVEEQGDVSILHIFGVEAADAGEVTCSASSESGENISCCCELLVQANGDARHTRAMSLSPECDIMSGSYADEATAAEGDGTPAMLLRGPADTTALRGDRVMLKATFVGCPAPNVRWLRAGRELEPNERICITTEDGVSCLALENITADDSGKYVVSVENIFGADCHFASVAVEGPPDPPAGRPSVSSCDSGAMLTWSSAPYDGGCMVTGFCVEMRQDGSSDWQPIAHVSHSLSYVVRDLTPGDSYVFRVRAENIHGESEPSMESAPFSFQVDLEDECFTPAFEPRLVTVEPGDEFKTKYDVLEELGKGRYGVVHKVVERDTSQKFAAKFIRCIKAKDREKVQEEIDIMNCLRHPKLLQLAAAFESPREMVMVMEYISGGELFERVVADDFTLTERDCILFMRQICEGVDYMHQNLVVHLDLKPENIMCHTRTSHQIKLIDFGLARKLQPDIPVRVLFGTPEFIPPEIINYEPIGVESDMWSVGVICYVLLSGLSPFMGDNDAETFANITRADYDFDDEAFDAISQDAKDFISSLLLKRKEKRLTAKECLQHIWLAQHDDSMSCVKLSTDKLKKFIIRRKWQLNVLKRQPA